MPPRFDFPGDIDVWERSRWDFHNHSRAAHFMEAVARLAPGVEPSQADAAASGLAQRLERDFASTNRAWGVRLIALMDDQLGYYRPALIVVFGAVGLLMLIGCLNVASLLLTRALSREREIAVRTALGASPRHLVVQLLAEAAVLSAAGAAAGTIFALVALPAIVRLTPVDIPRLAEAAVSWRVLLFALGAGAAATMVFGLVPAVPWLRRSLSADLRSGGERGSSRATRMTYRVLVAGEVALACALLVASGLLIRTVARMADVPTGVGNPAAITASVQFSASATSTQFADWRTVAQTYGALIDHIGERPGVRSAGASNFLPLDAGWRVPFLIEGRPPVPIEEQPQAQFQTVTAGYFEAIGAARASGRFIDRNDVATRPGAVVVNETFVRRFLPAENPIGKAVLTYSRAIGPLGVNLLAPPLPPAPAARSSGRGAAAPPGQAPHAPPSRFEIVGVVKDVRNVSLARPVEPAVYFSAGQYPFRSMFVAVDAVDAATGLSAIQSALRAIAPSVPLADARTWAHRMAHRTGEPRLLMTVLVFFGTLAAALAVLGVYGLFSWMVALKERELAIRLTLGARPARIGWGVVRQAAVLTGAGLAAGWTIVRAADPLLARVLFDVEPGDPWTIAAAVLGLLAASLLSCALPAWRAMRVDPIQGLRVE